MHIDVNIDDLIRSFKQARDWANGNNRGNEAGTLERVIRDLEAIRNLPSETFAGREPDELAAMPPSQATLREARMTGMDYAAPPAVFTTPKSKPGAPTPPYVDSTQPDAVDSETDASQSDR